MTLPSVKLDTGIADESTLISALAALAASAGWTTVTAGGKTWFFSRGSTGDSQIVGGLTASGTRQLNAFTASDLDQNAIVSGTVAGYVNNDSANTTALVAKILAPTLNSRWSIRDNLSTFTYVAVASLDAVVMIVRYLTSGVDAEGFIYIGIPESPAGKALQRETYGKIAAIDASNPSAVMVTLDRDINSGLKDSYQQDPYVNQPLFQSVSGLGMPVTDFALVQRISILNGSLTKFNNNTRFNIDATVPGKLTGTPGGTTARYAAGRGIGDIVRLFALPNIATAGSATNGIWTQGVGLKSTLASHDAYGGQGNSLDVQFTNTDIGRASVNRPSQETGRWLSYKVYCEMIVNATTMVAQPDNNGKKDLGALRNLLEASFTTGQIANLAMLQLDSKRAKRYRTLALLEPHGIRGLDQTGGYKALAVGPGW